MCAKSSNTNSSDTKVAQHPICSDKLFSLKSSEIGYMTAQWKCRHNMKYIKHGSKPWTRLASVIIFMGLYNQWTVWCIFWVMFWHLYIVANIDFNCKIFFLVAIIGSWKYQPQLNRTWNSRKSILSKHFYWQRCIRLDRCRIYVTHFHTEKDFLLRMHPSPICHYTYNMTCDL